MGNNVKKLFDGIINGNRIALAQSITLIESTLESDRFLAEELISRLIEEDTSAIRIGISGPPGVGKSTWIDAVGMEAINRGMRVGVLAVDPSSHLSGGSILGDKTRMEKLSMHSNAFIRPSPAGNSLGGVHRNTREAIILLEKFGCDLILVETVGVGQSEHAVHGMVDLFLLLLNPDSGDELQGIKKGIVELADYILIHKADGDNLERASKLADNYLSASKLFPESEKKIERCVRLSSAFEEKMVATHMDWIVESHAQMTRSGMLSQVRNQQFINWVKEQLEVEFYNKLHASKAWKKLDGYDLEGEKTPYEIVKDLLSEN